MKVIANGKTYEAEAGATVAAFIRERGMDPAFVIVERNGESVPRERYEDERLAEGDLLELVRAVAGGAAPESTLGRGDLGEWRRRRLAASRLYVVTGARAERGDLEEFLEAILDAGTDVIQLREKDAEAGDLLRWAETFRAAAERHQALFFVNDRADVALAAGADGVHVGQNDLPPSFVRELVGPDVLIGLSTHGQAQFDAAAAQADCLSVGPVYATPTKPGRPATGRAYVRFAASREAEGAETRPWFAIGGIDAGTLLDVKAAGARRIVVVRAVTEAEDPGEAVRALTALLPAV